MEHNNLRRMFDQVKMDPEREDAILADLLWDKKEVFDMKNLENKTIKRRIPRTALVAAVLAVALAGTALAVEIVNRAKAELIEPNEDNISTEGYHLEVDFQPISLESLSEEALERVTQSGEDYPGWCFDTWTNAADFLGLDVPENPVLAQLPAKEVWHEPPEGETEPVEKGRCFVGFFAPMIGNVRVPAAVFLDAEYQTDSSNITQFAYFEIDIPEAEALAGRPLGQIRTNLKVGFKEGVYTTEDEQYSIENYVTPSGLETQIISRSGTQILSDFDYDLQGSTAHFVIGNAYYTLTCVADPVDPADTPATPAEEVALLKEILDAYE